MAGTSNVSFTMQELGNPVSLAGQGEQAGPETSSLCDRSSSQVGDLACVGLGIMLQAALSKITSVIKIEIFFATCVVNLRLKNTEDLLQI